MHILTNGILMNGNVRTQTKTTYVNHNKKNRKLYSLERTFNNKKRFSTSNMIPFERMPTVYTFRNGILQNGKFVL